MKNKKIIILALSAFVAAFGTYRAFKDLADALESADFIWDEEDELTKL
jgi:hypothetical protein